MSEIEKHLINRLNVLKAKKEPFEPVWNKAAELCYVESNIYEPTKDNKIVQKCFDSTARNALSYFVSSMKSTLVPSSERWHSLRASNPNIENDYQVQAYTQRVTDLLFKYRFSAHSRFAVESDLFLTEIGIYGVGAFYLSDNIGKGITYRCVPINELYIDEDEDRVVETIYRKYKLTAREAYKQFGDKVSQEIKDALKDFPDREFEFLHAVEPRKDINIKAKDFKGMKYASYHMELGSKRLVKEGGYRTKPYIVARYAGLINSPYGDSPAQQAFNDMLTANEMAKTILRTAQLQANPPVLTGNSLIDSSKLGRAGAIVRGGLDSQGRPTALSMQYGNNLAVSLEMQQAVRLQIEATFLKPLFQSMTKEKEMTATEVEKRDLEKSMVLAPMCERLASEWLAPMIERELDILSQYGVLDNVPEELMYNGSLAIEFESPYIRMQETSRIMGIYKTSEAALTFAQYNPSAANIFNPENAIRKIAEYHNIDMDVLRSPEEVEEINEQQAQAQQAQAQMAELDSVSKSMKNLGVQVNDKTLQNN